MFTGLYREEKKEEGNRGGQKDKRGEGKGGRQIQPVISSSRGGINHLTNTSMGNPS